MDYNAITLSLDMNVNDKKKWSWRYQVTGLLTFILVTGNVLVFAHYIFSHISLFGLCA